MSAPRPAMRVWRAGATLVLLLVAALGVLAPPERCPPVTAGELQGAAQATVDWFVRNQRTTGTWLYLYNADDDSASPEYNEVRHAGVTMGLYQAAAAGLEGALGSADRGTEWALQRLLRRDGWAALPAQGRVTVGAGALLLAGLVIRREPTGDPRHDGLMRRLARFLVAQTEPSGAVLASYDRARGAPVAGEYSKYYTGEAYWALARLHRAFPGEGWDEAADRIGTYLATSRDSAEGYWPPIPDHWAAYGLAETVSFPERGRLPLTAREVSYARRQAELFGVQARWLSQRYGPWGAAVRGTYEPRGGWYGVIGEAFSGLWLTAQQEPRLADLREPIAERATCIAGLAVDAQTGVEDAARAARPDRVEGAWFVGEETRMDDQQHALAALLRTVPIAEAGQRGSHPAPSGWLWAVVLLLALNPARAALGVPRTALSPTTVTAVGGTIGALAVCAAALVGDPLLEALDVSEPSFRTAAGVLAAVAGCGDLFRRPPTPEPALPGWRAALVPVAIPLAARPTLIVLALGAGADGRIPASAAAISIGIALLAGLVAAWPIQGPPGRVLEWASRLTAASLVACGIILAIDGILSV